MANSVCCVQKRRPAAAVGPVHAEPYLNRWVSSPMGNRVPGDPGPAYPNESRIPGHVVLAHVDWNLTRSAGQLLRYYKRGKNASHLMR